MFIKSVLTLGFVTDALLKIEKIYSNENGSWCPQKFYSNTKQIISV